MKISLTRRVIAAVATAGLLLVAAPVVAPASAADACAAGATCEGALTGKLGTTPFKIQMPTNFNGTVLMYSHGYRISTPIPAALAQPLGLTSDPSYTATQVPSFAAAPPLGFGSATAYVGNNNPDIAPNATIAANLLSQGYALAGVGYASQGWAINEALEANTLLLNYVNDGAIKGVKKVLAWGQSFGGLVAATFAEQNPKKIAGVLPACGALAGPLQAMQSAMTVMYTWKSLIAPSLKVANYTAGAVGYGQALTDLATVLQTLSGVAAGTVSVSSVGYPVAQANLLGGLMGGLPTASAVYDGQTVNPAFAQLGTAAALAGGYSPSSAGASTAAAMLQNVGAAAALGIMVRYDLETRARALASIPADQSANVTDNVNVSYTKLLSPEQRGEFGDVLNATTVMPNLLNAMLATLDSTKGNATARFAANPAAVKAIAALPAPKGTYTMPTVLISTTYDPVVPAGNTGWYYDKLIKSAKKQGELARVGVYYTVPPADGWTTFDAGAKTPNAAASAAKATSGVGHCNWAIDGGIQIVNAIKALERMVAKDKPAAIRQANRIMWATVGVNGDGFYEPDALKRPRP